MEDDKRLDLSLGLPIGKSSSKSNEKISTSVGASPNGGDRANKILNDFRNFLNGGISQQPQASFFNFPPSANACPTSGDGNPIRFRSSTERLVDLESENTAATAGDKRKHVYEEMSSQKKQETDRSSELLDKGRTSHISITTDDGSTADNEDVAESDAETSRPLTNLAESSKHHVDSIQSITFKDAFSVGVTASSYHPLSGDQTQAINAGNSPITFSYSNGQLPFLDKDSPWAGMAARPPFNPYPARPLSASGPSHGQSEVKQPAVEEGSSTKADDHFRVSNSSVTLTENSFPSEFPAIRPGMAADLKFGGSGSLPNLPWVSTTGPGPNGRTISGVTYRFSANQIKIVCACHGLHMSPEEFIQHASDEPPSATDSTAAGSSTGGSGGGGSGSGLASFSGSGNAAASAKS